MATMTTMTNQDIIDKLSDLLQLDVDAAHAYDQALKHIDEAEIHLNISNFREDHMRHIDDLAILIRGLGGTPPTRKEDLKGYLIEGFTALRSVTGTTGALKAMRGNEKLTNRKYSEALECNLSAEARAVVQKNYEDEKRHLAYIERVLTEKAETA